MTTPVRVEYIFVRLPINFFFDLHTRPGGKNVSTPVTLDNVVASFLWRFKLKSTTVPLSAGEEGGGGK